MRMTYAGALPDDDELAVAPDPVEDPAVPVVDIFDSGTIAQVVRYQGDSTEYAQRVEQAEIDAFNDISWAIHTSLDEQFDDVTFDGISPEEAGDVLYDATILALETREDVTPMGTTYTVIEVDWAVGYNAAATAIRAILASEDGGQS